MKTTADGKGFRNSSNVYYQRKNNKRNNIERRAKTELREGLNVMEHMLENYKEELNFQSAMEEPMLESDDKGLEDEGAERDDHSSDSEEAELAEVKLANNSQKSKKQSLITDIFVKQK